MHIDNKLNSLGSTECHMGVWFGLDWSLVMLCLGLSNVGHAGTFNIFQRWSDLGSKAIHMGKVASESNVFHKGPTRSCRGDVLF